jgi:molybdenum cofactor biosynthesis protein B
MGVPEEHREKAPEVLGYALVTASDSRDETSDAAGRRMAERVEAAGQRVVERLIVPDEAAPLRSAVTALLAQPEVDVVVVSGGTGVAPRDVTIETLAPLFDRDLPGFGELFRALSFDRIGAAAMLSRAAAGVVERRALFLLPGSPAAVELALDELILPEAAHLVAQARR